MELEGKVVIVTGAAGNLGSACARHMAHEGARVVVSDLPGTSVKMIVDEIVESGAQATAHEGDVSDEPDVVAMIDTAWRHFGRLDVLVNVAANLRVPERDRDLESMDVDWWDRTMAVNIRGAMLGCKHAIPRMLEQGGGAIVNFTSTAALLGDIGLICYSTTKAALIGFTRSVATTYGKQGIRCNAIAPGSVWSADTKAKLGEEWLSIIERTRTTPRLGVPADIADMAVYLASDKASYITGQTFVVDGGGTIHQPWVRYP